LVRVRRPPRCQGGARMRQGVGIAGARCVLVPYRRVHVEKYHGWMEDERLRELTGSERLSLEEEYAMCETWAADDDKLTFIVLDRALLTRPDAWPVAGVFSHGGDSPHGSGDDEEEVAAMCGDTNLYFSPVETVDEDGRVVAVSGRHAQAECEIMVAETGSRKMGIGREAMGLCMEYAQTALGTSRFFAKVRYDNPASRHLFVSHLNFSSVRRMDVFEQEELERLV